MKKRYFLGPSADVAGFWELGKKTPFRIARFRLKTKKVVSDIVLEHFFQ